MQRTNERLLKLLSDVVKQAASTEETINKQLEDLIQETSQNEEQFTQGPMQELESGTLFESQIPTDSFRRPANLFPGGLVTSTPAAGPTTAAANFGTPAGGKKPLARSRKPPSIATSVDFLIVQRTSRMVSFAPKGKIP